jgi:hypothetical protein
MRYSKTGIPGILPKLEQASPTKHALYKIYRWYGNFIFDNAVYLW